MTTENSAAPSGRLMVRTLAMPADTNANGDIFGGWVLSQMDLAGGIAGGERSRGRVATVAVEAMSFLRPVRVGDVLSVYTQLESVGRSSMRMRMDAWINRLPDPTPSKVAQAIFVIVAIDEAGRPRPVPDESSGAKPAF